MSWASYLTQFGSGLLVFPLILTVYSDTVQSFWFLTETISGLALMADFGFGSVLTRAVSYFKAGANHLPVTKEEYDAAPSIEDEPPNLPKLKDLLTTSFTIYYVLTGVAILLLATAGRYFIRNVIEMAGNPEHLWIGFYLLIPYVGIAMNGTKWRSFVRGLDFMVVEARFSTVIGAFKVIAFMIMLSFGLPPMYLIMTLLLMEMIRYYYFKNFVKNWFRKNNIPMVNNMHFDRGIFSAMWATSWKLGGIFWGNYLIGRGNDILVSQISNAKLMASFLITTRILTYITQFSQISLYSVTPKIYQLSAQKKHKELKELASGYMFLGLFLMSGGVLALILFGNTVLRFLSDNQLLPVMLLILMSLTSLLEMHASFHASIYTSTNHIPFLIPTIVSGAIIFGLGYYTLPLYGIPALILIRLIVGLAFNYWFSTYLSLRLLRWKLLEYLYELPVYGMRFLILKVKSLLHRK